MRFLTLLILTSLVAGCGFSLRGASLLPESMKQMTVQAEDLSSELVEKLENELRRSGVELLPGRTSSAAELTILSDTAGERVLSVSSSGRPKEYELYHSVVFSLRIDNTESFAPVAFTLTRDYFFDEQDILGKTEDASFLRDALAEDVARAIVRRAALLVRERGR